MADTGVIPCGSFLGHDTLDFSSRLGGSPVSATTESRRVDDSTSTRPTPTEVQPELATAGKTDARPCSVCVLLI